MIASLVLASILLVLVGFYKLVQIRSMACEAGNAPDSYSLNSSEEWAASIEVALELAWFQTPSAPKVVRPKIRKIRKVACTPIIFTITSITNCRTYPVIAC